MKHLSVIRMLKQLNRPFVVGYYGGGNFGDELIMEKLMKLMKEQGIREASFYYAGYVSYSQFHEDYGYRLAYRNRPFRSFIDLVRAREFVIGGGGLWGHDANFSIFLLGLLAAIAKGILKKKVYLVGVGYYTSANHWGRWSAYIAGKAADDIIVRGKETYENFIRISSRTFFDRDIAEYVTSDDWLSVPPLFEKERQHTLCITVRPVRNPDNKRSKVPEVYREAVEEVIARNLNLPIRLLMLEASTNDPVSFAYLRGLAEGNENVQVADFDYNPLRLVRYFQENADRIMLVSPQLHSQLMASMTGVPFLPVSYNNKCDQLFASLGIADRAINMSNITYTDIQQFIDYSTQDT